MHYYHATFFTNRDSILEHGITRDYNRLWEVSRKDRIYMTGNVEDALFWVILWYSNQLYDISREKPTVDKFVSSVNNLDRINDGIAVFEINANFREVRCRERDMMMPTVEYSVRENIPPDKITLVRYVSPEEVKERLINEYKDAINRGVL